MLPIRFSLDNVEVTKTLADIEVQVKDEYKQLIFTPKPEPSQVPISFIGMPAPKMASIQIVDSNEIPREMMFSNNSWLLRNPRRVNGRSFSLPCREALITDVVNLDRRGQPVPLFYRHDVDDTTLSNPQILDMDQNRVSGLKYKIVVEDGKVVVFHDLAPQVNYENLKTSAYFISYTKNTGDLVYSLLESRPAFLKATFEEALSPRKRRYTSRKRAGHFDYLITYQGPGPFYVRVQEENQLKLKRPLALNPTQSWYMGITDGEVFASLEGEGGQLYHIPEYHLQAFAPIEPYRFSGTVECLPVTNRLVKLPHEHISNRAIDSIEVLLTTSSIEPVEGWTTAPSNPQSYWVDRFDRFRAEGHIVSFPLAQFNDRNVSINREKGLLHLPIEIPFEGRVFARYKYKAESFDYMALNVNPLFNRRLQTERAVIYCWPDSEVDETLRAIFHFYIDDSSSITYWNDERLGVGALDEDLEPDEGITGLEQFVEKYPQALILGIVGANRLYSVTDLVYIDVRRQGAVLIEEVQRNIKSLIKTYPELQWVEENSITGRSLPLMNSALIKVPFDLLSGYAQEDLEHHLTRHLNLGAAPIIEYYDENPATVISTEYEDGFLDIIVKSDFLDGDKVRVFYSDQDSGDFSFEDLELIEPGGGFALIRLTIAPRDTMFLYLSVLRNGVERPSGPTVRLNLNRTGSETVCIFTANVVSAASESLTFNANIV